MANCRSCGSPKEPGQPCESCVEIPTTSQEDFSETTDALDAPTGELLKLLENEETRVAHSVDGSPAASVGVTIRPRLEFPSVPRGSDPIVRLLVDVTPDGPPFLDPRKEPVAHVILLLDVSASMNHPDKYPVLTEALSGMLHDLASPGSPEVLLSVVVFAQGAKTLFRDVRASTLSPRDVLAKIDASPLRFGRYTDAAGALKRAGRIAVEQLRAQKAMPIRVYVLTDGKPQDLERTRHVMTKISKLPVDVDGLAFGEDADVALLQELVSGGRGGTVKQVRSDTLGEAFDRIAEVARRVVSNRAIFELELSPGVVGSVAYRYRPGRHRFGDDAFADGKRFRTDLGTLESGRTYSMLFELRLPETTASLSEVGRISVRLRGTDAPRVFETAMSLPRTAGDATAAPDGDVLAAADVLAALTGNDPKTQLRALRVRRKLYVAERRDPHVIGVIDKAIEALDREGSLDALSSSERATLRSHTCTAGSMRPSPSRREFAAG
jgi:uncharacterized protein YegL